MARLTLKKKNTMKEGTKLTHRSGRIFKFIREYHKDITGVRVVELLNTKTEKTETFLAHTYKQFFKVIQ